MHVLESMGTTDPPIQALSFEERYKRLWEVSGCLKDNVMIVLERIETCPQVEQAKIMLNCCKDGKENQVFYGNH